MAAIEAENLKDCIEACRTCGVFFLTTSNFLRQIFTSPMDDPEMNLIRMELLAWNVEINQNDGFPQYICTGCILDFQKVFKFRRSCIEMQQQLRHFYNLRQANANSDLVQVKTELPDPDEADGDNLCDFIYVDDVSDGEYDGSTPFTIPHVPIKEERIEEATVPPQMGSNEDASFDNTRYQSVEMTMAEQEQQEELMAPPPPPSPHPAENSHCSFLIEQPQQDDAFRLPLAPAPSTSPTTTAARRSIHADIKDFECHVCGKEFKNSTASRLKFHLKWHKISKHIKCVQCGFFCGSRVTMREHMRAVHTSSKCTVCGKLVFARKMKSHMRGHQQQQQQASNDEEQARVEDSFSSVSSVLAQNTRECSSQISKPNAMETSANDSATAYEIICSHCEQKFTLRSELEQHWQEAHHSAADDLEKSTAAAAAEETQHVCFNNFEAPTDSMHEDNTSEMSAVKLALHNSTTTTTKFEHDDATIPQMDQGGCDGDDDNAKFDADSSSSDTETGSMASMPPPPSQQMIHCDAAASIADEGKMHSYVCAQCTQTFASITALCTHHETHVQKPKFSCHICGKSFDLKFSLNRHLKKHVKAPF